MVERAILAAALLLLSACGDASARQAERPAGTFPAPDRPIAEIVSPTWSSGPDRDKVDENGQIVRALGVSSGMTVADIGAGSGYHTIRLSPLVGSRGIVYAQDITEAYLADLRTEIDRRKLANVRVVLGKPDDPGLPAASVDRAILVHMYHEIEQPYALMWRLAGSLKPGALVGVVDLDRPTHRHGTPPSLLKCEIEAVGYRQVRFRELSGDVGYIAVFAPPAKRPEPADIKPCRR